jgi:hypothetical protein
MSGSDKAKMQIERIRSLNPTRLPEVREKIRKAAIAIGHRPRVRGGNGQPIPEPQRLLFEALGEGWEMDLPIGVGRGRSTGVKKYTIDIANRLMKIAIEADGGSHAPLKRQESDRAKDAFLTSKGWTVLRFSNKAILAWINSGMPPESFISMTLREHGIIPSALKGF